jgi:hypothetical protein
MFIRGFFFSNFRVPALADSSDFCNELSILNHVRPDFLVFGFFIDGVD